MTLELPQGQEIQRFYSCILGRLSSKLFPSFSWYQIILVYSNKFIFRTWKWIYYFKDLEVSDVIK